MVLSIIEFAVYGFFTYTSMLMLIISIAKEAPKMDTPHSIMRAIYSIPGIISAFLIAAGSTPITVNTITNTIINLNTTETHTEAIGIQVDLANPVWVLFHILLGMVLIIFLIEQLLQLWPAIQKKRNKQG